MIASFRALRAASLHIAATLAAIALVGCWDPPKPVGEWMVADAREAIVFNDDGTFELLYYAYDYTPPPPNAPGYSEGTQIPGSGKWRLRERGTYTTDLSKEPAWIDMVVNRNGTPRRQQGLMQFLDDNTMYIAVEDTRPATINASSRRTRCTRAAPGELRR